MLFECMMSMKESSAVRKAMHLPAHAQHYVVVNILGKRQAHTWLRLRSRRLVIIRRTRQGNIRKALKSRMAIFEAMIRKHEEPPLALSRCWWETSHPND